MHTTHAHTPGERARLHTFLAINPNILILPHHALQVSCREQGEEGGGGGGAAKNVR